MRSVGLALSLAVALAGCTYETEFITYDSGNNNGQNENLYEIDPQTCAVEQIEDLSAFGDPGIAAITSLDFDTFYVMTAEDLGTTLYVLDVLVPGAPTFTSSGFCPRIYQGAALCADGNFYGVDTNVNELRIINPADCTDSTLVGTFHFSIGNAGLACHPTTDEIYLVDSGTSSLYTISKTDGSETLIGPLGTTVGLQAGLEFDPLDASALYATWNGEMWQIDPTTGDATFLCDSSIPLTPNLGARVRATPSCAPPGL